MTFTFRWRPEIFNDMLATLLANSNVSDIYPGSVATTLLQAPAIEIAREYAAMSKIIDGYSLDTIEGEDLDNKAFEYNLTRNAASGSSGSVTITDSTITKISTTIYPGTPGPISGATTVNIIGVSGLTSSGTVIIGRNTSNVETIDYSSYTDNTAYVTLNLSSGLANDHGTEETVILSQGGNRIIGTGTLVNVPVSDVSDAIEFSIDSEQTLLDGEDTLEGISVTCTSTGSTTNVPAGAISEFVTTPFTGAEVVNPLPFVNGSDQESDQSLRDRIRSHGVADSSETGIVSAITGLIDTEENKRVVSATYVTGSDTYGTYDTVYIDDGTGFEPSYEGQGVETVIQEAAGSEQTIQLQNYPLAKAFLITSNAQPFAVSNGDTLIIDVDGSSETITFQSGDFLTDGAATAIELAARINSSSNLVDARTTNESTQVIIQVKAETNERLQVLGGTGNTGLGFSENSVIETLRLYKNDQFLYKDGRPARLETDNLVTDMDFSGGPYTFDILIDGITSNTITVTINSGDFVDATNPTADEIVLAINDDLVGATAESIFNGTKIRLSSNKGNGVASKLFVQPGGSALGSTKLDFITTEVTGIEADYILNRFNGQIILDTPLTALDNVEAGSRSTRGFLDCASPEPYNINTGETLVVSVDGGGNLTYTFGVTDSLTAQEIIDLIEADKFTANNLNGVGFEVANLGGSNYLRIRTNWFSESGSIEVKSTSTATALDFTYDTEVASITPNVAYVTSGTGAYILGQDQTIVTTLDGDSINRTFTTTVSVDGTITAATNDTNYVASGLTTAFSSDDFFVDFTIRFDDDTSTVALQGVIATISSYTGTTGSIVSSALGTTPAVGDTFKLIPVTTLNVVELFKIPEQTTLGIFSDIALVDNSQKVQISSLEDGSAGSVQVVGGTANDFSIPFLTDGLAGGTFTVSSISGLSVNLDVTVDDDNSSPLNVTITDIAGTSSPYTITVDGGATNLTGYIVSQNAVVMATAPLDFSNTINTGIDGYINYTGLLRLVQRTIDGWDADLTTYPGIKAAGSLIAVSSPVIQQVEVEVNVTTINGVNVTTVTDSVKSTIASYINGLKVGEDVIISEIITRVKKITGIYDVSVTTPSANLAIEDNAIGRIDLNNITVG